MMLFAMISKLCDHKSLMSQTERQTDRQMDGRHVMCPMRCLFIRITKAGRTGNRSAWLCVSLGARPSGHHPSRCRSTMRCVGRMQADLYGLSFMSG